jgi:response regulator RpfG family c-di-GMP phosphodiesterase
MIKYFGYHKVPKFLLRPNTVLEVDLYIFLPTNETMVWFRRVGDRLSESDSAKLMALQQGTVLTRGEHKEALSAWIGKSMVGIGSDEDLGPDEPIDPDALKSSADALLGTFHPTFGAPVLEETGKQLASEVEAGPKELLNEVAVLVEQVIAQMKKSRSASAYAEFLKTSKGAAMDPLVAHQRQVSALAALLLMSTGEATMDELSDLGAAGLIHDLGLNDITLSLRDQHLVGMDTDFSSSETLVYRRHPDLAIDQIKAKKVQLTPAAIQIVQQHHENWDGSGFKGLSGQQIARSARALRIADDLVGWMSNLMNSGSLLEAHADLSKRGASLYDPNIMRVLGESLAQQ